MSLAKIILVLLQQVFGNYLQCSLKQKLQQSLSDCTTTQWLELKISNLQSSNQSTGFHWCFLDQISSCCFSLVVLSQQLSDYKGLICTFSWTVKGMCPPRELWHIWALIWGAVNLISDPGDVDEFILSSRGDWPCVGSQVMDLQMHLQVHSEILQFSWLAGRQSFLFTWFIDS